MDDATEVLIEVFLALIILLVSLWLISVLLRGLWRGWLKLVKDRPQPVAPTERKIT